MDYYKVWEDTKPKIMDYLCMILYFRKMTKFAWFAVKYLYYENPNLLASVMKDIRPPEERYD